MFHKKYTLENFEKFAEKAPVAKSILQKNWMDESSQL